ncbi:MAG: septal ring lytic transglycosylase RlpA family protein [Actinomycetota bacterium]|nr:septal ring lytic transglycosylase RlpA family protein [Actinomycetota bacterium]
MKRVFLWGSALALVWILAAGATAHHRVIRGEAVYYANSYAGQTMACGGRYQPWKMVAAHRTLPCGTRLRVKNRSNGREVIVRVKDRGPYGEAILDLSRRAARKLRYIRQGRTPVRAAILHN